MSCDRCDDDGSAVDTCEHQELMGFLSAFMSPPKVIEDGRIRLDRNRPVRHTTRNRYADLMSIARLQFIEPDFDEVDFFLAANEIPKFIPNGHWSPLRIGPDEASLRRMRTRQRNRSLAISVITAGLIAAAAVFVAFRVTARVPSQPSWIRQMGGAVVTAAPSVSPAPGSAASQVLQYIRAEDGLNPQAICRYLQPSDQPTCTARLGSAPAGSGAKVLNYRLGYTAMFGNEALVALDAIVCTPGRCTPTGAPATAVSSAGSFANTYRQAVAAAGAGSASPLVPCVEVGSSWYVVGAAG